MNLGFSQDGMYVLWDSFQKVLASFSLYENHGHMIFVGFRIPGGFSFCMSIQKLQLAYSIEKQLHVGTQIHPVHPRSGLEALSSDVYRVCVGTCIT